MRSWVMGCVACSLLAAPGPDAAESGSIREVTVFLDGALVTCGGLALIWPWLADSLASRRHNTKGRSHR